MEFRPCIDLHNGKVKQIVGSSLKDELNNVKENFVSDKDAAFFATLYKEDSLKGGHVILLNTKDSPYYEKTKEQAFIALEAYPGGLQIGGGINDQNAKDFLHHGASHVIVTSFVFQNGSIQMQNLKSMVHKIGKEHLVLDLSCKRKGNDYYIVTDRWQNMTNHKITVDLLNDLSHYADEFLIHAVDVEGKISGIESDLVTLLSTWGEIPVTYAGGISGIEDLCKLRELGKDKLNATIGSALDIFGGDLSYQDVVHYINENKGV